MVSMSEKKANADVKLPTLSYESGGDKDRKKEPEDKDRKRQPR
jgi:hypothetical protein